MRAHRDTPPTARELEVLGLVCAGTPPKAIGNVAGIAYGTVRNHLARVYHALGANGAPQACAIAVHRGLIIVPDGAPPAVGAMRAKEV